MKRRLAFFCSVMGLLAAFASAAHGQAAGKFEVKHLKQYWFDSLGQPWNDTTYQMAVTLDPQFAQGLPQDISSEDSAVTYTIGAPKLFSLKRDATGTYADVDYLAYADKDDPITYRVELKKGAKSASFVNQTGSKVEIRRDTANLSRIQLKENNPIMLDDWLMIAGVLFGGAILLYVLVFRWLFKGLLFNRRWGVSSAEHFTWSMSLLGLLALAAALTVFYLGPRIETWVIIGVMGAFWLLHAIVWLASGKEA
jgi:hypothetical protein